MPTTLSTRKTDTSKTAVSWMYAATKGLDYPRTIPFNRIADKGIEVANVIYNEKQHELREPAVFIAHLGHIHRHALENKLWRKYTQSLDVPFRKLPHQIKTIYEIVLLSSAIAINQETPKRTEKVKGPDDGESVGKWLENVWRARQEYDIPFDQDKHSKTALDWENTSGVLGMASEDLRMRFGGTFNLCEYDFIRRLNENAHKLMIEYKLWGNDTEKYKVEFDDLPQDMKDNYILMTMSALAALSENAKQDLSGCDNGSD